MILFIIFLLIALCSTICFSNGTETDWFRQATKEIFCFIALLIGLFWAARQSYYDRLGLLRKLRLTSGYILLSWGLIELFSKAYPIEIFFEPRVFGLQIVWLGFQVILVSFLCVQLLAILKSFVYVQQTRWTARQYQTLLFMIFLLIVSSFTPSEPEFNWDFERPFIFNGNMYQIISQSLLVFMALIIGFRCKWMHYLNRQQKLASTGLGIALLVLIASLIPNMPGVASQFSVLLSAFIQGTLIVLFVYISLSVLGLLLQLPAAGLMDRRMQDIRSLQQISATIGTVFNRNDLLLKTTELALEILHADFTWIELKEEQAYHLAATSGIQPDQIQILQSRLQPMRDWVQQKDEVLMVNDIYRSRFFQKCPRYPFWGGSLLVAHLKFKHQIIGLMFVGKISEFGFIDESRGLFRAFCDQIAVAIENGRLVELSIEREVYKEELRVAHQAQMRLLPQSMPHIKNFDVDGFCLTANDIGGDFYDYVYLNEDRVDIVIGDVSGKGAAAAFYMAELKGVIQSLAPHFHSPKTILVQINEFLCQHMESNMFVTMIYLMFDLSHKKVQFARAGHEPLGYIHKQQLRWIEPPGLGLGLVNASQFSEALEEKQLKMSVGDGIFLYTDGLIEIRNEHAEEFGFERLSDLLSSQVDLNVRDMNLKIKSEIQDFCGNESRLDDMTAVMIRCHGVSQKDKQ